VRRAVPVLAAAVLLAGPTVIAFFSGGYFDGPRAAATTLAWALVLLLAVAGPVPLPATTAGRVAAAALAGLAVWTAVSVAWAPVIGPAFDSAHRVLLYLGVLLAATAVLRDRSLARAVEPALAGGALVVIAYGLSGRLLPGLVELNRSFVAGGRLEQPLTYWNAEGLLAAMGLVLCVRLAGDPTRSANLRAAAAAACAPLGAGVYLSYSRGAVVVAVLGLIFLLAAVPTRPQVRAALAGLAAAVVASAVSAAFRGVAALEGSDGAQERDGAIVLVLMLGLMLLAALLTRRAAAVEATQPDRLGRVAFASRFPALAKAATVLCVVGLIAGGLVETAGRRSESAEAKPSRFVTVSSLRYEYWGVGADAFLDEPLSGNGAGSFRVIWRQERDVAAGAVEVHSLALEMATELGIPGLLLLGLFVGGVAVAGRRALQAEAPLAPAACAVCGMWLTHALIDWDWQMPAVTLPALVLAGALLAEAERAQRGVSRQRTSSPTTRTPSIAVSFLPASDGRAL
jgi:O-Antigen ligase